MADTLTVSGLGKPLDGTYEFDIASMLGLGNPDSLTNREGHRLKTMTGIRIGQLGDALSSGDSDVIVALAAIILTREGKRFDEAVLWDAPMGSGLELHIEDRPEEDDDGPPAVAPETETEPLAKNGGPSSSSTSALQESALSPTGSPDSETPSEAPESDPVTSET